MVLLAGGEPVSVPTTMEDGFKMRPEALEKAITPKTKWIIFNSPSNPTGAAYTRDELKKVTDVLVKHPHVHVMTDDMYEHLVYDDFKFFSPARGRAAALRSHAHRERHVEGLLHDRLAHRLCRRTGAADQGDGDDPVAIDLEPVGGVAMGRGRGAQRACRTSSRSTTRSSRSAATSASRCSTSRSGLKCPKPEGAFYVYPSCAGTIGKHHAERQEARNRRGLRHRVAGSRRRCGGAGHAVRASDRRSASPTPPRPKTWKRRAAASSASAAI